MQPSEPEQEILNWLKEQGYSAQEIEKIQARLADYDDTVVRSAIFDAINKGELKIEELIKGALAEEEP